jgi:plastocyanin
MRSCVTASVVFLACAMQMAVGVGAAAAQTTHTVVVAQMMFSPKTLTVKRGDTVVWVNKDFFPHTATARDGSFDSKEFGTHATWAYVAEKPGTFAYTCLLHPTMKATLIVK